MKFKLNAIASACLLGTLLGCAPLTPLAPLADASAVPTRSQTGTVPVKVAPANAVTPETPSAQALYSLGLIAHGAGQLALAGQHYAQALKMVPDHLGALNGLAVIYAQTDRTFDALKLFAYAIELAPASAHIRNNAGYALLREGRLDEAESALNKARELDPNNAQTQQNLALLASARAKHKATELAGQPAAGDKDGPRLVVVAPNVFELQAPTNAPAEAGGPARETSAPVGKDLSPGSAISVMPAMSAASDLRGVRLEVSNGVGITRLARRTADRLATEGVKTARLTNAKPYRQAKTEIQYPPDQAQAARALQSRLPVATQIVLAKQLNARVNMRLVLGHDMAGKAITAWLEAAEKLQLATSQQPGGWRWS
ncbi:LytR C-terminal domain-containing protein [Rhodoferax sp.]|uniref:LytR C-terminal domain-containing protein n=1 Tax=Rhodoferax sp. TaxID=50421 RepID=UPI0019E3CBCA|nr:LytR C-terminal domain-containing protein [Rhodoferax sp.]MBE0474937.1 tetratricopeptide repeat protein [Rhodoferax sp.]